jgi:tRNA (Thr-GGU) A37 N-methylase
MFAPESLTGLADFSHIEVLFHRHGVEEREIASGLRHPRGNANWPQIGIFAQRAKVRPNRIAATICRLLSVDELTLTVQGLDALDGSPVLDIKPVFAEFVPDHASIRQPEWSHALMKEYFASGSSARGPDRP